MLDTKRKITYAGKSIIGGVAVAGFQATIDSDNPSNLTMSNWVIDKELYKANHSECLAHQEEFENMIFSVQDELIEEKKAKDAGV